MTALTVQCCRVLRLMPGMIAPSITPIRAGGASEFDPDPVKTFDAKYLLHQLTLCASLFANTVSCSSYP